MQEISIFKKITFVIVSNELEKNIEQLFSSFAYVWLWDVESDDRIVYNEKQSIA